MRKNSQKTLKSFVFYGRCGCLMPFLILFNLFFGWIILPPLVWLVVGAGLILLFIINSYIILRRVSSLAKERSNVVDVEAEVLDDQPRLK